MPGSLGAASHARILRVGGLTCRLARLGFPHELVCGRFRRVVLEAKRPPTPSFRVLISDVDMHKWCAIFGVLLLIGGAFSYVYSARVISTRTLGLGWRAAWFIALAIGVALGFGAVAFSRYPTPDYRLLGFPFLAAEFVHSPSGGWVDFVGVLTLPATIGILLTGMLAPQLVLALLLWSYGRRRHRMP